MRVAKNDISFAIFTIPICKTKTTKISKQYKKFQDIFEKKNVNMLTKYRQKNCAINF